MTRLLVLLTLLLLVGCTPTLTYTDAQATAQAGGCWPDYLPTPPLVTVTPTTPQASSAALPTATPFARCPPRPGATAVIWPTPVPPPPAYPTLAARPWQTGSGQNTTLHLPSAVLALDLAVHPTEGWPAVGSVVWSGTNEPERVMLSVYNPQARRWSVARQVDLGPAQMGRYSRTVAVGISGDGTVHALWGMSDAQQATGTRSALWASSSSDFGESWSAPTRIAEECRRVNAVVAGLDGTLVAQLVCAAGSGTTLAMVTRRADGTWLPVERLPAPVRFYSEGALTLVGDGDTAQVIGFALVERGDRPVGYLLRRRLVSDAPWQVEEIAITAPAERPLGARMANVHGLSFPHAAGDGVLFTWTDVDAGGAYALTSLDGGQTWGDIESLAVPFEPDGEIVSAVPAYDPVADCLVAVWDCCSGGLFSTAATTHYGSWRPPESSTWLSISDETPLPLVLGSRAAGMTVGAQANNSRFIWIAWVERQKQVEVRSLDLNTVIPISAYPTATPITIPGGDQ
jgi:hypothetical protein